MRTPPYTGPTARATGLRIAVLACPLLFGGCSMAMLGSDDGPATTGSIAPPVEVRQPLPETLAYADAARIGEAAVAALSQLDDGPIEWANAATGSSGTLEPLAAGDRAAECGAFSTLVTSIGGVHQYTGTVCRDGGPPVVEIDAP